MKTLSLTPAVRAAAARVEIARLHVEEDGYTAYELAKLALADVVLAQLADRTATLPTQARAVAVVRPRERRRRA